MKRSELSGRHGTFLWCPDCGEQVSATSGDYFMLGADDELPGCPECGWVMVEAREVVSVVPLAVSGRHASPQAWRRVRKAIGAGEADDLAADIVSVAGGDLVGVARALADLEWGACHQL